VYEDELGDVDNEFGPLRPEEAALMVPACVLHFERG
jgi:hypothetical protein